MKRKTQEEIALQIVNDIAEGIDNKDSVKNLRWTISWLADRWNMEAQKRAMFQSDLAQERLKAILNMKR